MIVIFIWPQKYEVDEIRKEIVEAIHLQKKYYLLPYIHIHLIAICESEGSVAASEI